jgi:CIC family chloride channel protein
MDEYTRTTMKMVLLSALVGLIVAVGAIIFYWMVEGSKHLFLGLIAGYYPTEAAGAPKLFAETSTSLRRYMLLLLPMLGGLLSGLLVYFLAPEAKGHGTDGVIDAYHHQGGKIRPIVPLIKAVASAITIGTGGSAGKEGPISQIGAGIASTIAKTFSLHKKEVRILMMAGLAAGIGAVFRAPLAAALFAADVLYRDLDIEEEVIVPSIISSIIAYALFAMYFGWEPLFAVPDMVFRNVLELIPYTIVAIVVSQCARLFIWMFYRVHACFEELRLPLYIKPAIGGLLVGSVGFFVPDALGEGYGIVQEAFSGGVTLWLLAAVAFAKMVTTTFTLSSGGSGGVFGPSLVIGGCLGGAIGLAFERFTSMPLQQGAFIMLGMAGFFAAAARTPISTIVMVCEITGGYHLLVPTMWVCILSFLLNRSMTLFQKQLPTRFDAPAKLGEMMAEMLVRMKVSEVYRRKPQQEFFAVREHQQLREVVDTFHHAYQKHYPLVNKDGLFLGVIDQAAVRRHVREKNLDQPIEALDLLLSVPGLKLDDTLRTAIKQMIASGHDELFILDNGRPIGLLNRHDIIDCYDRRMRQEETKVLPKMKRTQRITLLKAEPPAEAWKKATREVQFAGLFYDLEMPDKSALFHFFVNLLPQYSNEDRQKIVREILEREAMETTTIGDGIAIPHPRRRLDINGSDIVIAVLHEPMYFGAFDGKPVDIVCFVLCSGAEIHQTVMRTLALAFTQKKLAEKLRGRSSSKNIAELLQFPQAAYFQSEIKSS